MIPPRATNKTCPLLINRVHSIYFLNVTIVMVNVSMEIQGWAELKLWVKMGNRLGFGVWTYIFKYTQLRVRNIVYIITDRIRRMTEGTLFTGACHSFCPQGGVWSEGSVWGCGYLVRDRVDAWSEVGVDAWSCASDHTPLTKSPSDQAPTPLTWHPPPWPDRHPRPPPD